VLCVLMVEGGKESSLFSSFIFIFELRGGGREEKISPPPLPSSPLSYLLRKGREREHPRLLLSSALSWQERRKKKKGRGSLLEPSLHSIS